MYAATLSPKDRERYEEKIRLCGVDPFTLQATDCLVDVNLWPRVDAADICEFLVLRTSFVTRQQLKARKALDGHNFVTSGWVREPRVKQVAADSVIVMTQVTHSQALNKPPVEVWILGKNDGEILAAHCSCMAGNGEACSHIAALLFYVEYGVRAREERSCTDGPNSWLPPAMRKLDVRPVAEMDLSSSAMKKRRIDTATSATCAPQPCPRLTAPAPTTQEMEQFLGVLIASGHRPAVASTCPTFSKLYVPAVRSCKGADLRKLFDKCAMNLSFDDLVAKCAKVYSTLHITAQAISSIESRTRKQSMCTQWYVYRAGRITASLFYDVCHTKLEKPSLSLIKRICYPHQFKLSTAPVRYGKENEGKALDKYKLLSNACHENVVFKDAGLLLSEQHVFLGATPDLLVQCSCCGEGLVEVKCPWSVRDRKLSDLLHESNSYVSEKDGALELKNTHKYYFQVQVQLYIWQREYCDFVVWNKEEISVERIVATVTFLASHLRFAEAFFCKVLLLELVGRWFTKGKENEQPVPGGNVSASPAIAQSDNSPSTATASGQFYCVCKGPEEGNMIACDGPSCPVVWYHFKCVGLKRAPKCKQWFCEKCKK